MQVSNVLVSCRLILDANTSIRRNEKGWVILFLYVDLTGILDLESLFPIRYGGRYDGLPGLPGGKWHGGGGTTTPLASELLHQPACRREEYICRLCRPPPPPPQ